MLGQYFINLWNVSWMSKCTLRDCVYTWVKGYIMIKVYAKSAVSPQIHHFLFQEGNSIKCDFQWGCCTFSSRVNLSVEVRRQMTADGSLHNHMAHVDTGVIPLRWHLSIASSKNGPAGAAVLGKHRQRFCFTPELEPHQSFGNCSFL